MRYPVRLLTDDEDIVHQFRPHWRVLLPALGWGMLLGALVGAAFAALEPPYTWYALGAGAVIWLVLSTRRLFAWWFTNYVLTTERIIVRAGMIARTGTEIPLENINNVLFSQRVIERLLGYGDVLVESAGQAGQSRLMDIPDPEAFQSEIYRARELRTLHFKGSGARTRDVVQQLESLADLRERGHLSDQEFAAEKARLLGELPGVDPADVARLTREGELDLET
jgi:uncharacterized membrane protein YdbT with pleckstrin-like domain